MGRLRLCVHVACCVFVVVYTYLRSDGEDDAEKWVEEIRKGQNSSYMYFGLTQIVVQYPVILDSYPIQ